MTAARKHHGCTQAKLAAMLSISQGHLSDIKRGAPWTACSKEGPLQACET
ncbi:helix-turn-helix domain-containing protein [Methylobacterium platani]|nr:helix-turn-helix transcriptional regulator [Methylobacterium platani]